MEDTQKEDLIRGGVLARVWYPARLRRRDCKHYHEHGGKFSDSVTSTPPIRRLSIHGGSG